MEPRKFISILTRVRSPSVRLTSRIHYILITNLMHRLLFIYKL